MEKIEVEHCNVIVRTNALPSTAGTNGLTFFFLSVSIVSINGCDKIVSKKVMLSSSL